MDLKALLNPGQKAIPAHPMLMGGDPPLTIVEQGSGRKRSPLSQKEAHRHLQAYGGVNDSVDWVMDCVRLIAETGGNAPWFFKSPAGEKFFPRTGDYQAEEAAGKPAPELLTMLFKEPAPGVGYEEMMELIIIDLLLVGNSYLLKYRPNEKGQPLAMYRMAPPHVRVVPGKLGIDGYEYQVEGQKKPLKFGPEEVVHFKLPNPHSPYLGLGVIQGGARVFDGELALTDTISSYYEKAAQPSLIVQSDRRVPKDVWSKLKQQLRAFYSGPKNAGSLMVLESGLKAQSIAPNATDAAFAEITKLSRDRIASMFRVPLPLLGITEKGDVKLTESQRIFDTKTMRPLLNRLQVEISRSITAAWGLEFHIDHDYVMPIEDKMKLVTTFAAIPGVRVREVREYAGLEPLDDPEIDDMVLNLPGEDGEEGDTRKGFPDRQNVDGGRPPKGENTQPITSNPPPGSRARRPSENKRVVRAKALGVNEILDELETMERERGKAVAFEAPHREADIQPPPDTLSDPRNAEIDAITADLQGDLQQAAYYLERKLLDNVEGKALEGLRKRIRESEGWAIFSQMVREAVESAARRALSAAAIQHGRLGLVPEDDLDYEELARRVMYRDGGIDSITKTMKEKIIREVGEGLDQNKERHEVEQIVREAINQWSDGKAETIAVTEAMHAYNEGTLAVAESAGVREVFVSDGEDHDKPCIEANGQVWDIAYARKNRIEHPRCRRAFVPVTE